ncbi:MAG: UDP-3-O-(3-hydroxymyristoyl)glucosamine N-acyltransferase [Rikenellaceae bacterium]
MEFTAEMIASFLDGEIVGNKEAKVKSVAKIEEAKNGDLAFLANLKYEHYIYTTKASIVIVNKDYTPKTEVETTLIKVEDAYSCFAQLLEMYDAHRNETTPGVSSLSSIHPSVEIDDSSYIGDFVVIEQGVKIGKEVKIHPQVYIGKNVKIGDNVTIYPGVKVYVDCVVGNNVTLHGGCVIGADGFGFAPLADGTYKKIAQIGNVVLEDNVEIGANTCVDRATMGSTRINKGVKLDNLIQIGHNVVINHDTVIAAQTGIAGSTQIGENCMIGGQVGFAGHITVAPKTTVASQSGIGSRVRKEGEVLMGTPAFDIKAYHRSNVHFKSLPAMNDKIKSLEKELNDLKQLLEGKL